MSQITNHSTDYEPRTEMQDVVFALFWLLTIAVGIWMIALLHGDDEAIREEGRQEIIEEAGQCHALDMEVTVQDCASKNGWDLKNG